MAGGAERGPRGVPRVAILSADVGEGHAAVADALADGLRARDADVVVTAGLDVLGRRAQRLLEPGLHRHLSRPSTAYGLTYRAVMGSRPLGRAGELALLALGARELRATVARLRPDVVVSTYPVLTATLGGLRAAGRLPVPVAATVSDVVGLRFWVHPGVDLHLLMYDASRPEAVRGAGGDPRRVRVVRPILRAGFDPPPARPAARAALGRPGDGRRHLVVVSGGGWGFGALDDAVDAALRAGAGETDVVALPGRSEPARARLAARYRDEPRVDVRPFTDQMPALLAAADALVHTTGGVTALEARATGCPLVCFGRPPGHIAANTRALERLGIARVAATPAALERTLAELCAAPRRPQPPARDDRRPEAADLVLDLAAAAALTMVPPSGTNVSREAPRRPPARSSSAPDARAARAGRCAPSRTGP